MKPTGEKATRVSRPRNRDKTEKELRSAVLRVEDKGLRMSISAVAAEAGVSPSLIHNTYPNLAEEIRASVGRSTRQQRDAKAAELTEARADLKELRAQLKAAQSDIATLASINETLRDEITSLQAQIAGKVFVMPKPKGD
ncbi:TetR family transcriptional regulator [Trinickia mobilis]|uniref:TetR family transcriptional regulator n=1 Tax=Trinickia mobilis TaxID=2816356 RepID=UPI001A8C8AE0|nr:TetR family transcriptional regulator [Trinickia mobilis]